MTELIIIIALIFAGVVVALVWRIPGESSTNSSSSKRSSRSSAVEPLERKDETPVFEPPAYFQGPLGVVSPQLYKDIREHLARGVDAIFDHPADGDEPLYFPKQREDVNARILEKALNCLDGMDRFQTQQGRLQKLLNDPTVQMTDLSKSITSDPIMTTKVLKMANSSYFGMTQKIDSIGHALMILGLQNVKNIIYREGLRNLFYSEAAWDRAAVEKLWIHSNLVCTCAQHFSDLFEGINRGALFTLGIVHDIGKLILMEMKQKNKKSKNGYPMDILIYEEDAIFGVNHAVIGGCILERWNFSDRMVGSVLMHHVPSFVDADRTNLSPLVLKYVLTLFLSDQLARLFMDWNERNARTYTLRPSYWALIDKTKLMTKVMDANFISQMLAAGTIAVDERSLKASDEYP